MLSSRKFAFAPLFGVCLAALAGCENPAITPEAPMPGAPVAGSGSVIQPQPAAAAGGVAVVIPVVSVAGSAAVVAGSGGAVSAGAGGGAAGAAGAAAGAGGALAAGSGGAGGAGGAAAGNGGSGGSAGAAGSDADDWLPIIGSDTTNANAPAAGSCSDLFCFDLLDCAIFHPEEAATCNFTACENFVCK